MMRNNKFKRTIKKIREYEEAYNKLSHEDILKEVDELKKKSDNLDKILPKAFALCVVASSRVLNMRHFDVQLMGGIVLHKGMIAEMKTGEGKTLVATCPVFLNALAGKGVHVITVNDYLAQRDSSQMGEVYKYLGMTCGCIYSGMSLKDRQNAYNCDITYGTNSEFGFDYLRDNMAKSKELLVQRGLNYVIIDEVDSVLIDDSRTPLIISGSSKDSTDLFSTIDKVVKTLTKTTNYNPDATVVEKLAMEAEEPNGDFILIPKSKEVFLTDKGVEKVEKMLGINLAEDNNLISHYITQSLKANFTMFKDVDYVVKDGKIVIVDESTGRLMESRKYSDNLHQAIEAKEGVAISEENKTHATITYQNFFRMYNKMAGMTGTAYTDKYEFKTIYHLKVVQIPTNKPVIREDLEDLLFATKQQKYKAIINKIKELHKKGQPILIGTPSVEESEIISSFLQKMNYTHNVLNAKNHEKEAQIIAQAGKWNAITVATNMAGRGTDILLGGNPSFEIELLQEKLEKEEISKEEFDENIAKIKKEYEKEKEKVIKAGGLAVIGVERFDNRRIDDQLRGRSGRQGDPGMSQFFLSLEDKMFKNFGIHNDKLDFSYTSSVNNKFIRNTQKMIENYNYSARKNTLDYDDVNDSQRKQIYSIRRQLLFMSDDEIFALFNKYKDEIVNYLVSSDEDISLFFRTKEIEKSKEKINEYIQCRIKENSKNLETHDNNIYNMLRFVMINTIDRYWVEYINQIISLKETVNITVMGSLKPIQLYKMESIKLFNDLIFNIKKEIIRSISLMKIEPKIQIKINLD